LTAMARANYIKKKFYAAYKNLDRAVYDAEKRRLQAQLLNLQLWAIDNKKRVAIAVEGRDAAGKGGTIKRFVEYLMPKYLRVVELGVPTKNESRNWFRRYEKHMPKKGEIVFFDRSWYNRALIEPTMGYCTERQYRYFMKHVVPWEEQLIADGLILIKLYLSVDRDTQLFRFKERIIHPLKYWKYTKNDEKARVKWELFTKYKTQMLERTASDASPWVVINANDKMYARLASMLYTIYRIPYVEKQTFKPLTGGELPAKFRIEIDGVPFSNLNYRQHSVLERLSKLH
jgi:polyphosphate kinase 2